MKVGDPRRVETVLFLRMALETLESGQAVIESSALDHTWQVEVDRSGPTEWSDMLGLFNDANLYQTWSYGSIRWGAKNLSHLVLKRDGEVLAMAQLRIVRPTRFKFGIAYLRWGPLLERWGQALDPEVATRIGLALHEEYVCRRGLFMRTLPNAFIGTHRAAAIQTSLSRFTPEPSTQNNTYRTFLLDLAPSMEELRRNLDKKWRNRLSSAEKGSLKIVRGTGARDFDVFSSIYNEMRLRKSFETTVDIDEFARIQTELPESQRMQVLICEDSGFPVGGVVVAAMGDSAIYVLGATNDKGLKSQGAYLLHWSVIRWLKDNGFRWYDLGGIDPELNPGVYHFKRGLSGADVCQLTPMVACSSAISTATVRAGLALQSGLRSAAAVLSRIQILKQPRAEA